MYHVESSHLFFLQPNEDTIRSQCSIISDRRVAKYEHSDQGQCKPLKCVCVVYLLPRVNEVLVLALP